MEMLRDWEERSGTDDVNNKGGEKLSDFHLTDFCSI